MPSPLVIDVRARIRAEERPLNAVERVLLAATVLQPADGSVEVVAALRAALTDARAELRQLHPTQRQPLQQLIDAVEALLRHSHEEPRTPAAAAAVLAGQRGAHAHAAAAPHWTERADRDEPALTR